MNDGLESWKEMLDNFEDKIIACTLTEDELNIRFNSGFGGSEGACFTAWSKEYVYFPVVYDGSEWIDRVHRNPCDIAKNHCGGE